MALETRTEIKAMLKELVNFWRNKRAVPRQTAAGRSLADNYVDAYQTVHKNIFGCTIGEDHG